MTVVGVPPSASPGRAGMTPHSHKGHPPFNIREVTIVQEWLTIIQSVGFPIAVATAMFIMLQNEQKAHREESEKTD